MEDVRLVKVLPGSACVRRRHGVLQRHDVDHEHAGAVGMATAGLLHAHAGLQDHVVIAEALRAIVLIVALGYGLQAQLRPAGGSRRMLGLAVRVCMCVCVSVCVC